ncbi:MAG: hypothetical protein KC800_07305 [Candidatus Eremiobacteraeota bacterium]|nr:hypothetical protein [Candidatus Eremiobacteraeota bacterium]
MKISFDQETRRGKLRYEIEFDLDDGAIMNDTLSIQTTARRINLDNPGHRADEFEVNVNFDTQENTISIEHEERVLASYDLKELEELYEQAKESFQAGMSIPLERAEELATETVAEYVSAQTRELFTNSIEELVTLFPAGDPIFGCAIKAGASGLIGQAVRCKKELGSSASVRTMLRCLREHARGIGKIALVRFIRCFLTLGFL